MVDHQIEVVPPGALRFIVCDVISRCFEIVTEWYEIKGSFLAVQPGVLACLRPSSFGAPPQGLIQLSMLCLQLLSGELLSWAARVRKTKILCFVFTCGITHDADAFGCWAYSLLAGQLCSNPRSVS